MSVQILRSIPHELRAIRFDGHTREPWIRTIYSDGSASLRYWIEGAHNDNENSGCHMIYEGDWIILDENNDPTEVMTGDISRRYTIHEP